MQKVDCILQIWRKRVLKKRVLKKSIWPPNISGKCASKPSDILHEEVKFYKACASSIHSEINILNNDEKMIVKAF